MLAHLIQKAAREAPEKVIVTDSDGPVTRYDFDRTVRSLAAWISERKTSPGRPVALCGRNSGRWLAANVGVIASGAVPVAMTYRATADDLFHLFDNSGAVGAFVDTPTARLLSEAGDLPALEWLVVIDDGEGDVAVAGADVSPWSAAEGVGPVAEPYDGTVGSMLYTAGTTGRPKGVYRPNSGSGGRTSNAQASMISLFDLQPDDVHLVAGPLYHGGPHGFAIMTLALAGHVVVLPKFDPQAVLDSVEQHGVTTTFMVPTMLRLITRHPAARARTHDTSTLRVVVTAGEPAAPTLKRDVAELFGPVLYEFFGASELGINAVMRPDGHEKKPGSCGKVLPGQELLVLDDDGRPVGPGVEGQLFVRNDALSQYWNDPDSTEKAMRDGYMSLGDAGYVDEDGYLYVTGRRSDIIKSGGVRITPTEIEDALLDHPGVLEAAVVGVPDETWGERVTACILPVPGAEIREGALQEWCRDRLVGHMVPKQVVLFDESSWPRMESGKVPKRLLVAHVQDADGV